jgi:adenylylsulfate kinase
MIIIQLTGLSGAGKTTIAKGVKEKLCLLGYKVEIIDGDEYRKTLCSDLGFSKEDRMSNIRRLGILAQVLARNEVIVILSVINPFARIRDEIEKSYHNVKTVWINCSLDELKDRDTKGLYKRALLPDEAPDKLFNLTGINDVYEIPETPHLVINTHEDKVKESIMKLFNYTIENIV